MLITKTTFVKWNPSNKKHYENLGYNYTFKNDVFEVKVEHLSNGSHSMIDFYCDYCGVIITCEYKSYLNRKKISHSPKDACKNCIQYKTKESVIDIYGVQNIFNLEENKLKAKNSIFVKYGVANVGQVKCFMEKSKLTRLERYGENAYKLSNRKSQETMQKKYGKRSLALSGEKHYRWRGGITPINQKERHSMDYESWRKSVYQRDNYTCQCCEIRGGRLNAHHLYSWGDNKDLRFDIINGITLCKSCHAKFHKTYGKGDNTKEQFVEFIANIRKGQTTIENTSKDGSE